jgi:anaerobic selenocysteine-containing dehydrogenase
LALHPDDAQKLAVGAGGLVEIKALGQGARLPVRIDPAMPAGTAGLTMVHEWSTVQLPAWSGLTAA